MLRPRLAYADPLQRLALLGVAAGAVTGIVVSLFRLALDGAALVVLGGDSENFEALPPALRAGLPLLGAVVIGVALTRLTEDRRRTGVAHVLQRLREHAGRLPATNAVVQFFAGTFALATGLSGGREGPAIHLGATASSLLGQRLGVPPDSLRILVACGAAAAIAGSFNTPMAGVVFAMEVVLLEYAVASFIPVGLAAVTATVVTRYLFGDTPVFAVGSLEMHSLLDVPFVVLAGFAIGTLGAAFTACVRLFTRMGRRPYWARAILAGAITAVAALAAPAVMGVGYDTVDAALAGTLAWSALAVILVAKLAASSACVGLGMPVGVIGPTLVMGAGMRRTARPPGADPLPGGGVERRVLRTPRDGRDDGRHPAGAPRRPDGRRRADLQRQHHPPGHAHRHRRHPDRRKAVPAAIRLPGHARGAPFEGRGAAVTAPQASASGIIARRSYGGTLRRMTRTSRTVRAVLGGRATPGASGRPPAPSADRGATR